ncbi:MAG: hypothetical protein HYY23_19750 [Verrucomicrobia bacterium]|nr:hypothetical protein [Verrucomicrobiota bacterium]
MKPEDLTDLLNAEPFRPFTVFTNDDRALFVGHREVAKLTTSLLFVFAATEEPDGIPDRVSILPLAGISRIDLPPRRARKKAA